MPHLPRQGLLTEYQDEKKFDEFIAGWTKYWNEVMQSQDPLDANLVKALIATESGFDPKAWNKKKGQARARGLMQVTDSTVKLLSSRTKELSDHFVNLENEDMLDPNLSVCAGVRWLFRKREILVVEKKDSDWINAIRIYKNYRSPEDPQMKKLIQIYGRLKDKP